MISLVSGITIVLMIIWLAYPFFQKGIPVISLRRSRMGTKRRELRDKKTTLILTLKELDFDYETGKLSSEDYKALKKLYEEKTVAVMKELEKVDALWKDIQEKVDERLSKEDDHKRKGSEHAVA